MYRNRLENSKVEFITMEGVNSIDSLLQEIKKNSFDSGSSCWVDITHINNPHNFFVRPRAYNTYMPTVQTRGKHLRESEVSQGNIVIYKSPKLRSHVRGKILSVVEGDELPQYNLFSLDFGLIEMDVPLKKIRRAYYTMEIPPLATQCQLANCAPLGQNWDNTATEAMKSFVNGERAKMIIKNKTPDSLIVELYNTCPDDIATLLALTGYTTLGYIEPTISRLKNLQL